MKDKECENCKGYPDGDYGSCSKCFRMIAHSPSPTKEQLRENLDKIRWLNAHTKFILETPEEKRNEANFAWDYFSSLLDSKMAEVIEMVEELKADKRFPHQSLLFGDCPNCGQEVNRSWIDNKCKEIRDEALQDIINKMKVWK